MSDITSRAELLEVLTTLQDDMLHHGVQTHRQLAHLSISVILSQSSNTRTVISAFVTWAHYHRC
jgi:hypothetical protein